MVDTPFLRTEESGEIFPLREVVTTVGRGRGVDIRLDDPSVSRLHADRSIPKADLTASQQLHDSSIPVPLSPSARCMARSAPAPSGRGCVM